MKKVFFISFLTALLTGTSVFVYQQYRLTPQESDFSHIWKTNRKLPEKIAMDAYLTSVIARKEKNIPKLLESYERVLKKDPNNLSVLKDFYVYAQFNGTPQITLDYLDKIPQELRPVLFCDYLKATYLFSQNSNKLDTFLKQKKYQKHDDVILPILYSWISAQNNNKAEAIQHLKPIQEKTYLIGYQEFLLGEYFQDSELKDKGLEKIQNKKLPALGFFPLLKKHAQQKTPWEKTALYEQFQKMETLYPATSDIIQSFGQSDLTAQKGLAEMFYLLSADGTSGLFSKEEAVFLNSIALFLQPDKAVALIWGAELNQDFDFPYIALEYYKKIPNKSATLLFKEASNLLLNNQSDEAEKIMENLEKTNQESIPLLTLMGQNYTDKKEYQKALNIYNRLIPLLQKNPQNQPLAEAYLARANLYQQNNQHHLMLNDLEQAQILMPEDAMLKNNIGYHYLQIGKIDEGFKLIESAYFKNPQDPYILDSMAFAYYKKNQAKVALPLAEKALNLMPQNALINMHLGDIYQANGRNREALFQYKKALDLKEDLTPKTKEEIQEKINQIALKNT
ncbi:MAG: tetratricopeptide repeat protein [Alphaproteobacteria bacterium]|nr:tetratricopeptide repeat protein [Alphaproteobacteria bacterium]